MTIMVSSPCPVKALLEQLLVRAGAFSRWERPPKLSPLQPSQFQSPAENRCPRLPPAHVNRQGHQRRLRPALKYQHNLVSNTLRLK